MREGCVCLEQPLLQQLLPAAAAPSATEASATEAPLRPLQAAATDVATRAQRRQGLWLQQQRLEQQWLQPLTCSTRGLLQRSASPGSRRRRVWRLSHPGATRLMPQRRPGPVRKQRIPPCACSAGRCCRRVYPPIRVNQRGGCYQIGALQKRA